MIYLSYGLKGTTEKGKPSARMGRKATGLQNNEDNQKDADGWVAVAFLLVSGLLRYTIRRCF